MLEDTLYRISVPELLQHLSPLSKSKGDGRIRDITLEEIWKAAAEELSEEEPWNEAKVTSKYWRKHSTELMPFHIRRIAYFVKHGIPCNDEFPIWFCIDNNSHLQIREGTHRIAAAAVIGGEIEACIQDDSGHNTIQKLLPTAVPLRKLSFLNGVGKIDIHSR